MGSEVKLNLGLDEEMIKKLAGDAILRAIDEGAREKMIGEALRYLLTVPSGNYGQGVSPLQEAFKHGMRNLAEKLVSERLASDEAVQAEIQKMVSEAWAKLSSPDMRAQIVDKMAGAITKAFVGDRY